MELAEALRTSSMWYGRMWGALSDARTQRWAPLRDELLRRARLAPGDRVLDVGTGTGATALGASAAVGDGYVVAVDNAVELLRAGSDIGFAAADMARLPFPDRAFDCVVSSFAIHAASPPDRGIREAHRVLEQGGRLAFSMFGRMTEGAEAIAVVNKVFERHPPTHTSDLLRRAREAFAMVPFGFLPNGPLSEPADPPAVVEVVRSIGFTKVEAALTCSRAAYPTDEGALGFLLGGRLDYSEMPEAEKIAARGRCLAALGPLLGEEGLVIGQHVLYVTAER